MKIYSIIVILTITWLTEKTTAQSNGPTPPRLLIPGAIPVRTSVPQQLRNDKFLSAGQSGPLVRLRRPPIAIKQSSLNTIPPIALPLQQQRSLIDEEAKPVTEEPEDNIPSLFIPQTQFSEPNFNNNNNNNQELNNFEQPQQQQQQFNVAPRFNPQDRPSPIARPAPERYIPDDKEYVSSAAQRFGFPPEQRQQQQQPPQQPKQVVRQRPIYREQRPQYDSDTDIQPVRRTQQEQLRPRVQQNNEEREKKPVAQILRKYREENEDGTITWGFENDDGSFKEEIIGIDCVTRGRYGYIDPDGVKREYNYETGILCDPNKRGINDDEEDSVKNASGAYIDYQENKMILANGDRIDLANIGKNKSRRPAQQHQQNIYRN